MSQKSIANNFKYHKYQIFAGIALVLIISTVLIIIFTNSDDKDSDNNNNGKLTDVYEFEVDNKLFFNLSLDYDGIEDHTGVFTISQNEDQYDFTFTSGKNWEINPNLPVSFKMQYLNEEETISIHFFCNKDQPLLSSAITYQLTGYIKNISTVPENMRINYDDYEEIPEDTYEYNYQNQLAFNIDYDGYIPNGFKDFSCSLNTFSRFKFEIIVDCTLSYVNYSITEFNGTYIAEIDIYGGIIDGYKSFDIEGVLVNHVEPISGFCIRFFGVGETDVYKEYGIYSP